MTTTTSRTSKHHAYLAAQREARQTKYDNANGGHRNPETVKPALKRLAKAREQAITTIIPDALTKRLEGKRPVRVPSHLQAGFIFDLFHALAPLGIKEPDFEAWKRLHPNTIPPISDPAICYDPYSGIISVTAVFQSTRHDPKLIQVIYPSTPILDLALNTGQIILTD